MLAGGLTIARSMQRAGLDPRGPDRLRRPGQGAAANCLNVPDNIRLVAVADAFEDQARTTRDTLKEEVRRQGRRARRANLHGFRWLRAGHRRRRPDVVLLCTPPGFRPMQYEAAVAAGKHVFMEKPVCVDAPGYRSIMKANKLADEKKLKVVVGLQRARSGNDRDGETDPRRRVGEIQLRPTVTGRASGCGRGSLSRLRWSTRCGTGTRLDLRRPDRRDARVHHLDNISWVMHDEHPVEANGMGGRQVRKGKGLRSRARPLCGRVHLCQRDEVLQPEPPDTRLLVRGGAVCADGTLGSSDCVKSITGQNAWEYRGEKISAQDQEHVDLIEAIRKDTPRNEGYYGGNSSMVAVLEADGGFLGAGDQVGRRRESRPQ